MCSFLMKWISLKLSNNIFPFFKNLDDPDFLSEFWMVSEYKNINKSDMFRPFEFLVQSGTGGQEFSDVIYECPEPF